MIRLIITDVTEMAAGNYCVAGWDQQRQRMVRPLPAGLNWTMPLLQQHQVAPGASLDVVPTGRAHTAYFPHLTEDTVVERDKIRHVSAGPINWFAPDAPATHASVAEAFDGHLVHNSVWKNIRQGVHVPLGTNARSLAALRVARSAIRFVKEFDRLKVVLNDGQEAYKLPVSSLRLKTVWQKDDFQAVWEAVPAAGPLHIRLGLARGYRNEPDKCYLMMNGIEG
jgi:hypothetical protein